MLSNLLLSALIVGVLLYVFLNWDIDQEHGDENDWPY